MKEIYKKYVDKKCQGRILKFHGVDTHTVYNTTPPLWLNLDGIKERVIAGRVERSDERANSRIMFFRRINPFEYELIDESPIITGEDPSITTIKGNIVLSVVLVKAVFPKTGRCIFETVYYTGSDIQELELCPGWSLPGKDNRLVEIEHGVAVTTRPQGKIGGLGTIAYAELESVEDLSAESVKDAKLLKKMFGKGWGGANELHWLPKKNAVGVVCHAAFRENGKRCYFSGFFYIFRSPNKKAVKHSQLKVIASRHDFPLAYAKDPDLIECVFTSGVVFADNCPPMLYAGLGDCCQGAVPLLRQKEIIEMYSD